MTTSICVADDCDRPAASKGMCHMHYKRTRPRSPDKPVERECIVCGTKVVRSPRCGYVIGTTCSNECRRILTFGARCEIPEDHPARWYGATCTWVAPKPTKAAFQCNTCDDCGQSFIEPAPQTASTYCSRVCTKRAGRRRRRAREHDAPGDFTLTQLLHQFARQGHACAYCKQSIAGLPDPEHVSPLSRGGRNDMSNIVAACRMCNADKNDLTLIEWAMHRAQRGLPAVDTDLSGEAYTHLYSTYPTAPAWRDRVAA